MRVCLLMKCLIVETSKCNKKVCIDRIPSDSLEKAHNYFIFSHLFKEIYLRNIIAESCKSVECLSAAWPSGSEGRSYVGHVRKVDGSTPTQAWLLRP